MSTEVDLIAGSALSAVGRVLAPDSLGLAQHAPWLDLSTDGARAAGDVLCSR